VCSPDARDRFLLGLWRLGPCGSFAGRQAGALCPLLSRVQPELKESPLWEEASFPEAKCHGLRAYLVPACPSPDDVIIFGIESERVSEKGPQASSLIQLVWETRIRRI
jgi:hypothetical protein